MSEWDALADGLSDALRYIGAGLWMDEDGQMTDYDGMPVDSIEAVRRAGYSPDWD